MSQVPVPSPMPPSHLLSLPFREMQKRDVFTKRHVETSHTEPLLLLLPSLLRSFLFFHTYIYIYEKKFLEREEESLYIYVYFSNRESEHRAELSQKRTDRDIERER